MSKITRNLKILVCSPIIASFVLVFFGTKSGYAARATVTYIAHSRSAITSGLSGTLLTDLQPLNQIGTKTNNCQKTSDGLNLCIRVLDGTDTVEVPGVHNAWYGGAPVSPGYDGHNSAATIANHLQINPWWCEDDGASGGSLDTATGCREGGQNRGGYGGSQLQVKFGAKDRGTIKYRITFRHFITVLDKDKNLPNWLVDRREDDNEAIGWHEASFTKNHRPKVRVGQVFECVEGEGGKSGKNGAYACSDKENYEAVLNPDNYFFCSEAGVSDNAPDGCNTHIANYDKPSRWSTVATTKKDVTLKTNTGKNVKVCQYITYGKTTTYEKTGDKVGEMTYSDGWADNFDDRTCVTIRNPLWVAESDWYKRDIDITAGLYSNAASKKAGIYCNGNDCGAKWSDKDSGKYVMRGVTAEARWRHTVAREDTGFNEDVTNLGKATRKADWERNNIGDSLVLSNPNRNYKSTKWTGTNWGVKTNYYAKLTVGSGTERNNPVKCASATQATIIRTKCTTQDSVSAEEVSFTKAASWNNNHAFARYRSANWADANNNIIDDVSNLPSGDKQGWSKVELTYAASGDNTWRSIAAGSDVTVSTKAYAAPAKWAVDYRDTYYVETYCSKVGVLSAGRSVPPEDTDPYLVSLPTTYCSGNGTETTAFRNTTPETHYTSNSLGIGTYRKTETLTGSGSSTSGSISYKLHRDFNFNVDSFEPSGNNANISAAGTNVSVNFTATVKRDTGWNAIDTKPTNQGGYGLSAALNRQFITAMNGATATIITYRIPANISTDTIKGVVGTVGSDSNYCNYFKTALGSNDIDCQTSAVDRDDFAYSINNNVAVADDNWVNNATQYTRTIQYTGTVPELAVGYKFCVAAAISKKSSTDNSHIISKSSCVNIGKRPTVHVWGGTVSSENNINTSYSIVNKKIYTSWGDLGVVANGRINTMSSGRGSVNYTLTGGETIPCIASYSPLTVANSGSFDLGGGKTGNCNSNLSGGGKVGYGYAKVNYGANNSFYEAIKDQYGRDSENKISGNITVNDSKEIIAGGVVQGKIGDSGVHVVHCNNDCKIANNIEMQGQFTDAMSIPQIIIISDKNINIDPSVQRVDAWLVAKGDINTCAGYGVDGIDATQCTNRLNINGSVYAEGNVNLLRTYGADNNGSPKTTAEEAERINLSGTTIIFTGNAGRGTEPNVTYIQSIPSRL